MYYVPSTYRERSCSFPVLRAKVQKADFEVGGLACLEKIREKNLLLKCGGFGM